MQRRDQWQGPSRWPLYAALTIGAVAVVTPFVWQILTSFKTIHESVQVPPTIWPHAWVLSNYHEVFSTIPFGSMLLVTFVMALLRTVGHLVFCSMAAYAFARMEFPGRGPLFIVLLSVMMIPPELFVIPQYEIMQRLGWLNSIQALFVPQMFSAFGVFLLRQFFMTLPKELDEAARVDGANPWQSFWRIQLPLARPGLIALTILTVLSSWKDLLWPLIVNTDPSKMPLAAGLASLQGEYYTNYPVLMAGALLAMLPVIVVFLLMQRQFIEGIAFSGTKG